MTQASELRIHWLRALALPATLALFLAVAASAEAQYGDMLKGAAKDAAQDAAKGAVAPAAPAAAADADADA
ncbi:MAG: hypothetical protein ACRERC_14335, partial [Candidatus Binatia bacterium]